jgi:hypothetical protein
MDLVEIFQTLRKAALLLARKTLTFVEIHVDEEGNETEESYRMDYSTFMVRSFAEELLESERYTKEEIEEALNNGGEPEEVPKGGLWCVRY